MKKLAALSGAALLLGSTSAFAQIQIDTRYKDYTPVQGVSGSLKAVGSDSLNNLMALWFEDFKKLYPGVQTSLEGKGSSTAPPALTEGTSNLGPMSREMRPAEIQAFEAKHGYKPTLVKVGVDTLAVFVNKDNPIECLTLTQLDAIFSQNRARGGQAIDTWNQAGLSGDFAGKPIALYGRNSASGTYGYFKEVALSNGDYKSTVKEQAGSSAVVQAIAADKYAIGYSGIGYKTADVKAVKVDGGNGQCVEPSQENAYDQSYPITRFLLLYTNKNPSAALDPALGQFLAYILSGSGQKDTVKDGYYPMPFVLAKQEREKLGLPTE